MSRYANEQALKNEDGESYKDVSQRFFRDQCCKTYTCLLKLVLIRPRTIKCGQFSL
jgi:hypothetical protein